MSRERGGAVAAGGRETGSGDALLGGSQLLWVQAAEHGTSDRREACVEDQEEPSPFKRPAPGRRLVSQSRPRVVAGSAAGSRGRGGANGGVPLGGGRGRRAAVPPSHGGAGPRASAGAATGRPVSPSLGDRDGLRRAEDTTWSGIASSCAARRPTWCGRSSTACCWCITPCGS